MYKNFSLENKLNFHEHNNKLERDPSNVATGRG